MFRSLIVTALLLVPTVGFAQQTPAADTSPARCLLGGKSFSPGATIRASSGVNVCNPDGTWGATDKPAAGCFFSDGFYSVGATAAVSNSKTTIETCGADGIWSSVPAAG